MSELYDKYEEGGLFEIGDPLYKRMVAEIQRIKGLQKRADANEVSLKDLMALSRNNRRRIPESIRENIPEELVEVVESFNEDRPDVAEMSGVVPMLDTDDPKAYARTMARKYNIPENVFLAQLTQESSWDENARSPKDAFGYAQLLEGTASDLGVDRNDWKQNIEGGAMYMRQQLDAFGSLPLALAAYNAGPRRVREYKGIPPFKETQDYIAKIMRRAGVEGYASGGAVKGYEVGGPADIARSVLGQGLLLGWGDEAEAWLRSKIGDDSYDETLARIQQSNQAYRDEYPVASIGNEVIGGLIPTAAAYFATPFTGGTSAPVAAAGTARMGMMVPRIAAQLPNWMKGAGIGATEGAIAGAGMADQGQSRAEGAAMGAAIGAPLGAAAPAVVNKAGEGYDWLRGKVQEDANRRAINRAAAQVPDDSAYEPLRERLAAQGSIVYSTKERGGNWLNEDIDKAVDSVKKNIYTVGELPSQRLERFMETGDAEALAGRARTRLEKDAALESWIDKRLRKYLKNDFGTPNDPMRKLAEEGKLYTAPDSLNFNIDYYESQYAPDRISKDATNDAGKMWEGTADNFLVRDSASDLITDQYNADRFIAQEPWLLKVPPDTSVYGLYEAENFGRDFDMPHLVDEMRNALNNNADLPDNLKLTPEQLQQMDLEKASRHVAKINEFRAMSAAEAEREGMIQNLNNAVRAETDLDLSFVGDKGGKWVDLPEAVDEGMAACTTVGKAGGWCTMGEGMAQNYGSGDGRLVALLDNDGRPHVQISVRTDANSTLDNFTQDQYDAFMAQYGNRGWEPSDVQDFIDENDIDVVIDGDFLVIDEIKPVGNTFDSERALEYAKRDPEYRKKITRQVQNFLNENAADYETVGDLRMYGLFDTDSRYGNMTDALYDLKDALTSLGDDAEQAFTIAKQEGDFDKRFITRGELLETIEPYQQKVGDEWPENYDPNADLDYGDDGLNDYAQGGQVRMYDNKRVAEIVNKVQNYAEGGYRKFNPDAINAIVDRLGVGTYG